MPSPQEIREKIRVLPEIVQDHLFGEEIADLNDAIMERNSLPRTKLPALRDLIREAVVQAVALDALPKEAASRLELDPEIAASVAKDIVGYRLLPLNSYLGDVDGFLRLLGGDPKSYPATRIQVEERTSDEAVHDVESAVGIEELPHRLKGRFEDAVRSYFKGVRTEAQLMDILMREEKIGGVNLDAVTAKSVLDEAKEEKRTVIIDDAPEETSAALPADEQLQEKPAVPAPSKPKSDFSTVRPEDEDEIDEIKKRLPEGELAKSSDTDQKIKASVEALYKAAGVSLPSEALQARFRKIIENRLRDIRDQLETLEILVQPKELGGMSFSQDDARRVLTLIEGKLKGVHARHQEEVKEKKSAWVAEESKRAIDRVRTEKVMEATARDEAFRMATAGSKKVAAQAPAPRPLAPANLPVPSGNAGAPVPHTLPSQVFRPLPAMASTARSDDFDVAEIQKQPSVSPVRPATSPVMPSASMKPVMSDVKSSSSMATGPIEDLRTTSLEDFRHLSKDPKEATLKIKDKIDLLGEDSFTKRSEGIKAWSGSGVFRLYLEMMGEALEGKPMDEVIAGRQAQKKPALTKEEIDAIVRLGTALRA